MHIGFITPEFPHQELSNSGGLGTSIQNLARSLVKQGEKTTVFVLNQAENFVINEDGVEIHSIKAKKKIFGNWFFNRKYYNRYIERFIKESKIDVLEAPDWMGITAFMKFTVPLVIRLNGSDGYFCYLDGRKQKAKNRFFEKKALKNADRIITVSTFTGELTNKVFRLNRKMKTIHNCINVDDFSPQKTEIKSGQVLYFGTLVRKKGVLELAHIYNKVIEQFPSASFLLIGNDNPDVFEKTSTYQLYYNELNEKARQKSNHINALPYEEVRKHIASANVIVLPSFAEAFPMTWLETLAMEKALVSSDIGWAKELMVNGETGYTVDPKNHIEYANKIVELLFDRSKCTLFGKAGRKRVVENFSTQEITKQNIQFYKSLI